MAAVLRTQLRNIRHALAGGGPDPPPLLAPAAPAWVGRAVRGLIAVMALLLALLAIDFGYQTAKPSQVVLWTLSVLLLILARHRPLLAWRIGVLLGLVTLVLGETGAPLPDRPWFETEFGSYDFVLQGFGPSAWFPGQILVFLVLVYAVGTSQRRGVLLWVVVASVGLAWLGTGAVYEIGVRYDDLLSGSLLVTAALAGYLTRLGARTEQQPAESRELTVGIIRSRWTTAATRLRQRLARSALWSWLASDLPRALAGGPDDPPALGWNAWSRRYAAIAVWIATVLIALGAANSATLREEPILTVLWPLSAAPLALMVHRPLMAWRLGWVLGLIGLLAAPPEGHQFHWSPALIWVCLAVLFVVGTTQPPGVLFWVWLTSVPLVLPAVGSAGRPGAVIVVTAILGSGYLVQRRRQTRHRLAEAQERGTVLTERARIARELHDVVAHHMSMIVVRSETAPYRLGDLPETARNEFTEISSASREALTEMRRLLGVLRSDEPAPMTAPQPGLADLPELVATARATGAEITVDVDATLSELPAAVDVSAYRIVQEALTNAARHALGAPVRVVIGRAAGGLALSVRNGPGRAPRSEAGPGHGVRGMRERAAMLGGELRVGPSGDGGFEVSATLPLRAAQ